MTGITAQVCRFVCNFQLDDASEELVRVAKRHLLDSCGVMLAGRREAASELAAQQSGDAGFLLGVRGHVLDYDDTQLSTRPEAVYGLLTHPSVPVLAAALSAEPDASGAELLAAFIAATEAECRIADAIDPRHYRDGFHSSGTVGTLGAALAAARVMKLDLTGTATALGIAASSAAGLRENFGTMTKSLHVGRAAQHGVEAARLARAGWTAALDILEAPRGFFSAFGGGFEWVGNLGQPFFYLKPGVSIKPHPSGSLSHPAMWVMLNLVQKNDLQAEAVEKVTVGVNSHIPNALIHHRPKDALAAKFSMEYAIATILLRRRGGLAEYTDQAVREPALQELLPRIEMVVDKRSEKAGYHRMLTRLTVTLKRRLGRTLRAEGDTAPMTDDEVAGKFEECARWAGLEDAGARIRGMVEDLENLKSVRELCQALL